MAEKRRKAYGEKTQAPDEKINNKTTTNDNGFRSCVFECMCEFIHVSKVQADSSGKLGVK